MSNDPITADFSQSRSDIYWKLWAGPDKFIRWTGYDDSFWWNNVSKGEHFRKRIGPATGRIFTLDPTTGIVTIGEPS